MSLPREIIRWLQSLDLPFPVKHPKRDLANGYIFAEICARYWPNVAMHSFENKHSQKEKESNWQILTRAFAKNNFELEASVVRCVMAMDDGYAEHVLQQLYTSLTKRQVQQFAPLAAAAVDQVPTFIRTNAPPQQIPTAHAQQQGPASPTPQQAHRSAADEEAKSEAEKRAALARQQARARATQKPQAIKQADDGSAASQAVPIQFAAVQVKPLPAHLMSRLSGGGASRSDGDSGPSTNAAAALVAHGDSVVGLMGQQIARTLVITASPAFALTSSCPDNATFFIKNIATIENSLRGIIWSQLNAQTTAIATFLLQRPGDYSDLVRLLRDLLFAKPSAENFSLTFLASVNQALAAHSPQSALSICQMFALPPLLSTLTQLTTAQAELAATFVSSFLSARAAESAGYLAHLVSMVYDVTCGTGAAASGSIEEIARAAVPVSSGAQRSFLLLLSQLVLRTAAVSSKKAARHNISSSDADQSGDDLRPSGPAIDANLLAIAHYNTVAGLHHESASVRTAALLLLLAVTSCGEVSLALDHYFSLVGRILGFGSSASSASVASNEEIVVALQIFTTVAPTCFAYAATSASAVAIVQRLLEVATNGEVGDCAQAVKLYILHVLCCIAHHCPAEAGLPLRLMQLLTQDGARDLRARLFAPAATAAPVFVSRLLGPLVVAATQRQWVASVFVEALLVLSRTEKDKTMEPAERRVTLTKTAAQVLKTGNMDLCVTVRVQFLHMLLAEGRCGEADSIVRAAPDGSGAADDGEVARWWANLQAAQPDLDFAIYCGELVANKAAKAGSEAVTSTLLGLAACAQHVAVRLYVDLSGLHTTASAHETITDDPALVHKASAWLRSLANNS